MKHLLKEYAAYNVWAHEQLFPLIMNLPCTLQMQDTGGSFGSLHKTVLHIWDAEAGWWQRLKLEEKIILPRDVFDGDTTAACDSLLLQSKLWRDWVINASDRSIEHVFEYKNSRTEFFKQPVYQVLQHVFNHSSFHRGQLVYQLRNLEVDKIPATDFIIYSRKK